MSLIDVTVATNNSLPQIRECPKVNRLNLAFGVDACVSLNSVRCSDYSVFMRKGVDRILVIFAHNR